MLKNVKKNVKRINKNTNNQTMHKMIIHIDLKIKRKQYAI